MGSSKIEVTSSSSSPFRCVLKDHNHRDRHGESQTTFQKNLKMLVKNHLHSCISISTTGSSIEGNENSHVEDASFHCWNENHSKSDNHINIPLKNTNTNHFSMRYETEGLSKCHSVSSRTSSSLRDPSPTPSDCSSSDLSVSSLLQKWRGLEAEARHNKCRKNAGDNSCSNTNVNIEINRTDFRVPTHEFSTTVTSGDNNTATKDSKTQQQQQLHLQQPQHKRVSSRGEISVADMVRTWANTNQVTCDESFQEQQPSFEECLARLRTKMDIREQRLISSPIVCSPKLRGRQAIADLFVKMEKERYKEIESLASFCAVTKFTHRGRIQSLLRLKYLRQEASSKQKHCRPPSESKPGGSNQSDITSSIDMLRERFCRTTKQHTRSKSASDQPFEQTTSQGESNINPLVKSSMQSNLPEDKVDQLLENSAMNNVKEDFQPEIVRSNVQRQVTSSEEGVNLDIQDESMNSYEEEDADDEQQLENINNQQCFGTNLDWTVDIARPRAYWEDMRKAWYHEIINTPSKNEDIRQLIKRGNVSSILSSDFREKMDCIMMSTVQRIMCSSINEEDEGPSMKAFLKQPPTSFSNYHKEEQENQGGVHEHEHSSRMDHYREGDERENDETNESENISQLEQYRDVSDYEQTPSPSRPWDSYHEDEPSDVDSDHIASPSLKEPSLDHSYYCHPDEGSSTKNITSIEVELIYDLRTHMQQLYQEMFELRKSITSCMDMQVKLQNSIKDEVSAAINHLDEGKSKSNGRHSKRGFCCICYEKRIDSLLYRCGHMCICFDCASELQWSSGKCPICRAQIVDVVRTYRDR